MSTLETVWFGLLVLVFCGFGCLTLFRSIWLYRRGNWADAVFIGWEMHCSRRQNHYYPLVRFLASDGKYYETCKGTGSSREPTAKAKYRVLYLPQKPQDALIYDPFSLWGAPLVCFVMACGVGVLFLRGII